MPTDAYERGELLLEFIERARRNLRAWLDLLEPFSPQGPSVRRICATDQAKPRENVFKRAVALRHRPQAG
jgi:hypothetical protein